LLALFTVDAIVHCIEAALAEHANSPGERTTDG
jgi:hypothetical protein